MSTTASPAARLVASLYATLKLMGMYDPRHSLVTRALESLAAAVRSVPHDEGGVCLATRGKRILVQDQRVRPAEAGLLAVKQLTQELQRRGIGAIHFPTAPPVEELRIFAERVLSMDPTATDPIIRLEEALGKAGVVEIRVEEVHEEGVHPVPLEPAQDAALRAYLQAMRVFRSVLSGHDVLERSKMRLTRRVIRNLVDRFMEREGALLALTRIVEHDTHLFQHSLHVCIYALALGVRLDMSRKQLGDLGLCALFHDVGKTIEAPEGEDERETQRLHGSRGARLLLQLAGAEAGLLKAAIVAYEHHSHHDRSGNPPLEHEQHLCSKIVTIADCFEALTSTRTSRKEPYAPHDAFLLMRTKAGTVFDPLLLKLFIQAVGLYPVGSLVELDSGEIGVVVAAPPEKGQEGLPTVHIIREGNGSLPLDEDVDLAAIRASAHPHTITRAVPQSEIFPSMAEHVAAL